MKGDRSASQAACPPFVSLPLGGSKADKAVGSSFSESLPHRGPLLFLDAGFAGKATPVQRTTVNRDRDYGETGVLGWSMIVGMLS